MRIGPLGTREIVASALLIIAVVAGISVTFLRDDNESQQNAAERLNATPTPIPPTPSPTLPPLVEISQPSGWTLQYGDISFTDGGINPGPSGGAEKLDLAYDTVPFNDMKDDQWGVIAQGSIQGDSGRWSFTIEYKGHLRVRMDGNLIIDESTQELKQLPVELVHSGGEAVLTLEARDNGGQFVLRWP